MEQEPLFVDLTHDEIISLLSVITVTLRNVGRGPMNEGVPIEQVQARDVLVSAEKKLIATHNLMIDLGL